MTSIPEEVIVFDGVCNLCNRSVQFVLRHDPAGRFRFAALQSLAAQRLLLQAGKSLTELPDSVVLVEGNRVFTRSTAALKIARRLDGILPLASLLLLVPAPLRDWGYDLIARNRYRLFGKQDACLLPTPALQSRFLSD